jgi:pimeloyl-ACP methyl ester carboxylesterase
MKNLQRSLAILVLIGLLVSPAGCMFMRLKQDLKKGQENIGLIRGAVHYTDAQAGSVIILLIDGDTPGLEIVNFSIINHPSLYAFVVPAGRYVVAAFQDTNHNMRPDPGEPKGLYGKPDVIVVDTPGPRKGIDLALNDRVQDDIDAFWQGRSLEDVTGRRYTGGVGILADLENPKFSPEYASKGLWQPNAFMKEVGYGLLFLEPYDPKRIPVLFVYGASGHAQNWRPLFDGLDHSRFQSWFFNYPTGFDLAFSGGVLNEYIQWLHEKYGFRQLFVVAHSMGGLVARHAILENVYRNHQDYIRLFVTISTPWGGHNAAALGVARAPAVVPSWRNMVPDSTFLVSLYAQQLPAQVPHHLIFSHSGRSNRMRENNDGAVTIASQLDNRAQHYAAKLYGLNEDHVGILFSEEVAQTLNSVMVERYKTLDKDFDWDRLFNSPNPKR